jgi:hypothetical protein
MKKFLRGFVPTFVGAFCFLLLLVAVISAGCGTPIDDSSQSITRVAAPTDVSADKVSPDRPITPPSPADSCILPESGICKSDADCCPVLKCDDNSVATKRYCDLSVPSLGHGVCKEESTSCKHADAAGQPIGECVSGKGCVN